MKKIAMVIVALLCGAMSVFAWDVGGKDYLVLAWPTTYTNGTFYSTGAGGTATCAPATNGFNLTAYNGIGKLLVFVSGDEGTVANTNTSTKVFLQHAAYATGSYATVSDAVITNYMPTLNTTAKVARLTVDLETLKNFVRIGVQQSSLDETNCQHTVGAVLVCPAKND